ncbi:DUF1049 domain-containing protein [Streptomyces sp. SID13666]|uniref:DUF1049 domain-containing protein n=1 Tax=Streptomyces TaxID=1883 RepID=UPI001106A0B8|nr:MULTISPECIES: DUF1049 domain-containing protein [Streptomyces]MCZ4100515.1 DUF1049 domain-containing protein [Streptomyces sp. H39-C1]NEA60689.1 DUF1049 domain-containing protein [Streptomyces sp. SID13666]NEA77075.1 DUF1049 domain-containing protein [Streptomyces sp. SID13588]QNA76079.1 DUF1049 domain-containing protein [Streptomyces sp. So13.3]
MSADKSTSSRKSGRELVTPGRIVVAALAVLGLVFIFENTRQVKIRLIVPEVTMPLWLALLAMAVIGGICGAYFSRRKK